MTFVLARLLATVVAASTYGLAVANLVISYRVLRPRPFTWRSFAGSGGGFIWMHIVCVTVPFQGFVTWGIIDIYSLESEPVGWRVPTMLTLCALIAAGYVIIFRVELARLRLREAGKGNL